MNKLKNIFKIILLIIFFSIFINNSFANKLDFYWEKNISWNLSSEKLNSSLEEFYKKTGLNTDIIILWKWSSCYLENNFDSCIQKEKNYSSDLLIVLSMKSDIKSRWDIRSLIKDEFKESITPRKLKKLQDNIIYYFKSWDYTTGLENYLNSLQNLIENKCKKIGISWNCDAVILAKNYHNYIAKLEQEKKNSARKKLFYYLFLVISWILTFLGFRKYYINNLNNLYKDVKYLFLLVENEKEIFVKDKEELKEKIRTLQDKLKHKLWNLDKNVFSLKKFYKEQKERFLELQKELQENKKYYSSQENLKNKVEELKKIDL